MKSLTEMRHLSETRPLRIGIMCILLLQYALLCDVLVVSSGCSAEIGQQARVAPQILARCTRLQVGARISNSAPFLDQHAVLLGHKYFKIFVRSRS